MAYLNPQEAFDHFKDRALEGIREQFPLKGRTRTVELTGLEVHDDKHPDDLRSQHQAKVKGDTWSVPVYADLVMKDNSTGKVLDRKKVRIAELPKVTRRWSHIVGGQEYQPESQWQLKPGAYTRRRQNGELETRFQTGSGSLPFDISFDDKSKQFRLEYKKSKLPLYPIMKAMGVADSDMDKSWGKDILQANKDAPRTANAVEQFYKTTKRTAAPSKEDAAQHLRQVMDNSKLHTGSTEVTLGKGFDKVTGEALQRATQKMLQVQAGAPEDDRDSLQFKDLRSTGDYAYDKIRAAKSTIQQKVGRKINKSDKIRDIVKFDLFDKPIRDTFHKNSAAPRAKQVNPAEMLSAAQQTTIMGPGGIKSEQSIMDEAKFVNPSHMGFLDPIHTPEGGKTGITLRLPIGLKKVGHEPQIPLYNKRAGKVEYVGPKKFLNAKVVLPDQVKWKDGKPIPLASDVKIAEAGSNDVVEGKYSDADYVMQHPSQFFNSTSNLIPFMGNTSGGRAGMATRHIEQAISLLDRQAPLVQVKTPSNREGVDTFEGLIGRQTSHISPVDGTVKEVKDDAIVLKDRFGKDHEVQLYRNYPLNDAKSVLDSTSLVKPGQKVKSGDVVADTNFTKNGRLALGTNLNVAYIPYKGYNFEDGIVISKSASKKLSSVHLSKPNIPIDKDTVTNKKQFKDQHAASFTRDQLAKVGDDGIVRKGMVVNPGDPLVLAMKKLAISDRSGLSAIRKSLGGHHTDRSLHWDGEVPGEVVGIHHKGKEITVHVKTIEPMQVGDKLAGRYGNKGIVTRVIDDDKMPHTKDGKPVEVALNPSGVPGRMNIGQVLETAASKIADKTGKPYVVQNFESNVDQLAKVKKELAQHGLSDTEEIIDPISGKSLGKALFGKQHMLKLHHQVDKKVSARSGLNLPGLGDPETYDINLQPQGGGHSGGQSMDPLGLYSLLAHGAKANIREMQTWKSEGPDPKKKWPSQHNEVWDAIQYGEPLPTPKPTFAFQKFTDMLKAAGINMEKKGHNFTLSPLTDKQILDMTGNRVLPKPGDRVDAKLDPKTGEPKPRPGGLFDEKLTGGHGGLKWSRIELAEPVPNPVFEHPIRQLTGLNEGAYNDVVGGEKAVDSSGNIVDLGKGATGGAGIKRLLDKIDVDKDLAAATAALKTAPASKVDKLMKRVKYLRGLKQAGLKPSEAYVLHNLPVLPPVMRPLSVLSDGNIKYSDINQLYSSFAQVNDKLKDPVLRDNLTDEGRKEVRKSLYDGVKALTGAGVKYDSAEHKGLIHQIRGSSPKEGYFQGTLVSRKQDMSMRSTIVPEPSWGWMKWDYLRSRR